MPFLKGQISRPSAAFQALPKISSVKAIIQVSKPNGFVADNGF
jgi:hypothetical protein